MLWNNLFFISSYYFLFVWIHRWMRRWRPDDLGATWIGKDRGQFVVNADGRLQLNIETDRVRYCFHRQRNRLFADMQWEFDVYMQNQPSDENKLCIYLYQENQERYYYVRIGNTGNKELGLKRNGNGNLILPQTDFEESPLLLHVKSDAWRQSPVGVCITRQTMMEGYRPWRFSHVHDRKSRLREATWCLRFITRKTRSSHFQHR